MDVLATAREHGLAADDHAWDIQLAIMDFLEGAWGRPDEGIWEVRGPRRHFTHSKVLAWVAFDRAVALAERYNLGGPIARWRGIRDEIHAEVCREGFHKEVGAFTQSYGSRALDASLLLIPLVGFLPADDPRVVGTIDAIGTHLVRNGLVDRYATGGDKSIDGQVGKEGSFLPCSFWLVDCLALLGRREEATELFERLLGVRTDLGLLSEEYDPVEGRLLGNFPQAFSHVGLVNSAYNLSHHEVPIEQRAKPSP
jgi:GH15 family glucan-1,4-alpha-glucosidase